MIERGTLTHTHAHAHTRTHTHAHTHARTHFFSEYRTSARQGVRKENNNNFVL